MGQIFHWKYLDPSNTSEGSNIIFIFKENNILIILVIMLYLMLHSDM